MIRILCCLLVPTLLVAPSAAAQSMLDSACAAPEHRQFDFWVGSWTVTDSTGERTLGRNEIRRVAGSCGLHEHWRSAQGGDGMSLNVWQPATGEWTQFWVGVGVVLRITGGLDARGRMVMSGDRMTPRGTVRDRITWAPLPSGAVRQSWDLSTDGGTTWQTLFVGIYRRTDEEKGGEGER